MELKTDKIYTISKNEYNGKTYYKINLTKKDKKEKKLIAGSINCRFKKDIILDDKQKIKILDANLDFYNNSKDID